MSKLSHSNEEFMHKIEENRRTKDGDLDHCECDACKDGVIHDSDCAVHNMPAYPIGQCNCSISVDSKKSYITQDMVDRFLAWPLPKGFSPDCGISFDGRGKDAMGYEKQWPVGTNLFSAEQAFQMLYNAVGKAFAYEKLLLQNAEQELQSIRSAEMPVEPVFITVWRQTQISGTEQKIVKHIDALKAYALKRDAELAALRARLMEVRESLRAANETPAITDTLWMKSGTETIFDAIDSIIGDEAMSAELLKEVGE